MICSLIRRHFSLNSLYAEPSTAVLLRRVVKDSVKAKSRAGESNKGVKALHRAYI
jgi:hypothetical protein